MSGKNDDIITTLKKTKWEEKSRTEVETFRLHVAAVKFAVPSAAFAMKALLRNELADHAKDDLAKRMFTHYLDKSGADFTLTLEDMKHMNSDVVARGHIDIRTTGFDKPNPAYEAARRRVVDGQGVQDYSGKLLWLWDNGAISTYTITYAGRMKLVDGLCQWKGGVTFFDRFDLDPRWGWSKKNSQGRSDGGERRTRIGYILDIGWDYDMKSPQAAVVQNEDENEISFIGGAAPN